MGSQIGTSAAEHAAAHDGDIHVPHLAVVESASVLRAWVRRGELTASRAAMALEDLDAFPARRWPAEPLLSRMWELRDNVTAYDANYVALAEALEADLLTADWRLARGLGGVSGCRVIAL